MTIAVQEAFEDRDQDGDSDSEIFQDANSDFDDEENSSKPFMVRFFSFFGSFRNQKEKNTEPDDQIQRYSELFIFSHFFITFFTFQSFHQF